MNTRAKTGSMAAVLMVCCWCGASSASMTQPATPASPTPPTQEPKPEPPPTGGLGDLDDLLGTGGGDSDESGGETGAPAALPDPAAPHEGELERKLSAQEASEAFVQAIAQMSEAATRLERSGDSGVVTQRLQEEIIRKLEVLIQSSQQSQSSSSSSSQGQQQQQQQQAQSQPQQQSQTTEPGEMHSPRPTEDQQESQRQMFESASAAWGALPERVRDMLLDGLESAFSANYKSMTEAYYRRLADEAEGQ